MKKITYILACACMIGFSSCESAFLDLDPLDARTDVVYFKTPQHFREYANSFYSQLLGWRSGIFDHMDIQSDLITAPSNQWNVGHGSIVIGYEDGRWGHYDNIRVTNILLQRAERYEGNKKDIAPYVSEAHFFRAYNYFYLLKYFGGVPIITEPLETNSPQLRSPRNSRYEVIDLILDDLQKAIDGLPNEQSIAANDKGHISRQAAMAFKARVLLYEATWRKYNGTSTDFEGSAGPQRDQVNEFLEESITLSKEVMGDNAFRLWNYNDEKVMNNESNRYLFCIEGPESNPGAHGRDTNKEFIVYSVFDRKANPGATELNRVLYTIQPSRKFIDMFVCKNGLPIKNNSQFKGYHHVGDEYTDRDYRLASYVGIPDVNMKLGSVSGYGNKKFVVPGAANREESANYPVLRLAEVYLNFAEAQMERYGEISDDQLSISINKLRARAGVAPLTNNLVNRNGLDMLQEIRRERTVELYMEGFRYDDLKRWGIAEQELNQSRLGMVVGQNGYPTAFKDAAGEPTSRYDYKSYANGEEAVETGDGNLPCVVLSPAKDCTFRKAHYLFPIPQREINMNPNLIQNPGYLNN